MSSFTLEQLRERRKRFREKQQEDGTSDAIGSIGSSSEDVLFKNALQTSLMNTQLKSSEALQSNVTPPAAEDSTSATGSYDSSKKQRVSDTPALLSSTPFSPTAVTYSLALAPIPAPSYPLSSASSTAAAAAAVPPSIRATASPVVDAVSDILSYRSVRSRMASSHSSAVESILAAPTLREKLQARPFQQQWTDASGQTVGAKSFCSYKLYDLCEAARAREVSTTSSSSSISGGRGVCEKIHMQEVIKPGLTIRALGDCSYMNSCQQSTCKHIHYEIHPNDKHKLEKQIMRIEPAEDAVLAAATARSERSLAAIQGSTIHNPPEWICCDIRHLDVNVLGTFGVIMMDPPWRIHMNLPYETMDDQEMLDMNIGPLQEEGICCVWVVTRALELGRRCLARWGYQEAGEILWVKVDQLNRLKRRGRTGPWLNHSKEHCLIGIKGSLDRWCVNRHMDVDVIVSGTRETSRKPEEVYGMLEHLAPSARRLEIFGRQHNTRNGWLTLGNQLDAISVHDVELRQRIEVRYGKGASNGKWLGRSPPK